MTDANGNGFTTKEILIRMEQKVDEMLADHETRIRANESSIARVKGAVAIVVVTAPVVAAVVAGYIH